MVSISHVRRQLRRRSPLTCYSVAALISELDAGKAWPRFPPASGSAAWIICSRDIQNSARLKCETAVFGRACRTSLPKTLAISRRAQRELTT
jgi:hypothetical protein